MNTDASAARPPRPDKLPANIREGVLFGIPAGDGRIDVLCVSGLIQGLAYCGGRAQPYFLMGNSDIRSARNQIANYFLDQRKECNQLVWIDTDIAFNLSDFLFLMQGPEDLVIAPYSRKVVGEAPVDFGMGFVRMHRRVLEKMRDWVMPNGDAALNSYMHKGAMLTDFFVNGPLVGSRWFGEDGGFFHFCALNDIKPRLETRCRLQHVGRFMYGYPDQLPGFVTTEAGAQ